MIAQGPWPIRVANKLIGVVALVVELAVTAPVPGLVPGLEYRLDYVE